MEPVYTVAPISSFLYSVAFGQLLNVLERQKIMDIYAPSYWKLDKKLRGDEPQKQTGQHMDVYESKH